MSPRPPTALPAATRSRVLAGLAAVLVVLVALAAPSPRRHVGTAAGGGPTYTLLQMNLCLSGVAACYPRTEYPAVLDDAVALIALHRPDAVTLDEVCRGDVARLARRTTYHFGFAAVGGLGGPLPCLDPAGRGLFGSAVLTRERITAWRSGRYAVQGDVEERRWACATTATGITVCGSHLATRSTTGGAAVNDAQCRELTTVLARRTRQGPTIAAGDLNRTATCQPHGMWAVTDAAADQAPGLQHAYGDRRFSRPRVLVVPMVHTDHDALVVVTNLLVGRGATTLAAGHADRLLRCDHERLPGA